MKKRILITALILMLSLTLAACSRSSVTEKAEESASNQTGSAANEDTAQEVSEASASNIEGAMNRFVNSINSGNGSMTSDGKSLFSTVNNGTAIFSFSLETSANPADQTIIYQTENAESMQYKITSLYFKDGWIYGAVQSMIRPGCDLFKIRTDGSKFTIIADDFSSSISSEQFYGDWMCFLYSDYKNPSDDKKLMKISLKNGALKTLDQATAISPVYFISDNEVYYKKGSYSDLNYYKIKLDGGDAEIVDFGKDANIKCVYQGNFYYTEADVLYRKPVAGGAPVVIMTSADEIPYININNDTMYFLWVSSLIYVLPLDTVNADRYSTPSINVEDGFWTIGLWLFDDQIFLQTDMLTSGSENYVNVTATPVAD